MKIWHKAGALSVPGAAAPPGWIVAIARNRRSTACGRAGADARHRRHGRPRRPRPDAGGERGDGRRAAADRGLPRAAARDRARAVRAAYVEGHSYEELARRFEVPLNTMRTWLRRALIALRECLGVMSDAPILPDDLPDDPDAALAAEYVLRLLVPPRRRPAPRASRATRPSRRRSRAGGALRRARRRLRRGGAAGAAAGARRGAAVRPRRRRSSPGSGGARALWRAVAAAAVVGLGVLPAARRRRRRRGAGPRRHGRADGRRRAARRAARPRGRGPPLHPDRRRAPPGGSLELWLLPEGATAPESLGVIPAEARFSVPVPARRARTGPRSSSATRGGRLADRPAAGPVLAQGAVSEL